MDNPIDEGNFIPVVVSLESPALIRFYFSLFFGVALAASYVLWKRVGSVETEEDLSLRGEVLVNSCILLGVYCFSWLPILLIGIVDGGLEAASVSSGFKGQMANLHCNLQDILVRAFCMSFVVSSAIYMRYGGMKTSNNCCCGRPVIFIWATFIPMLLIQLSRMILEQEEWLMPTVSITRYLSSAQFSVKATPALCVQMMDASWIRQILAEWFMGATLVVVVVYCLAPVFLNQKNSKSKSGQASDSDAEDSSELQMEGLLEDDPIPSKGLDAPHSQMSKAESLESVAERAEDGLFANGYGFLESILGVGVLWAAIVRPFMAITMYIQHTDTYSNHLDLPTHVLLVIAIAVLPMEFMSKCSKDEEKEKEKSANQKEEIISEEKDDDIIWIIDEEKGTAYTVKKDADADVDPIWIHGEMNKQTDDQQESTSVEHNVSDIKKTQLSPK